MKCGKCGEEVSIQPGRSANFCSNCGNKIEAEKSGDWKYFDNTKDLLAHIAAEYGLDALFSKKYLSDHASPTLPQGKKRLVSEAFSCGAVKILQDNMDTDQQHKEIAVKQAVKKLTDLEFSQEAAERIIREFTNAIGWVMQEPQDEILLLDNINKLMMLGWQSADLGDWKEAGDYFTKAREKDPSYSPAFLGLICVDLKCPQEDKLANVKDPGSITNHKYYKYAVADPAIKTQLDGYVQIIQDRIDAEQKEAVAELDNNNPMSPLQLNLALTSAIPQSVSLPQLDLARPFISPQPLSPTNEQFAALQNPQRAVKSQQTQNDIFTDTSMESNNVSVYPSVGSIIKFADIDWRVLSVENNKALFISEKILEKRPYNVEDKGITWENCTLRKYLNNEFYNKLGAAKSAIAETRNSNPSNPWYGTAGGNATTDRVFLLSLDELVKYFGDSGDLANKRRKDNKCNNDSDGIFVCDQYNSARIANYRNEGALWRWWLRSPGYLGSCAAYVYDDGDVVVGGTAVNSDSGGVRPALWLNL